ncbi:MAG: hypothetical protein U0168_22440 [Nannocystaceae bacterium]
MMELRARYKDSFEKRYGVRLGFMSFFIQGRDRGPARVPDGELRDRRRGRDADTTTTSA